MKALLLSVALAAVSAPGFAAWQQVAGEWDQYRLNESQMGWFKSVRSRQGIPCCNISDGHPTEMIRKVSSEGVNEFWIPNPLQPTGPWLKVPELALTIPPTNPIGVTVVWYVVQNGEPLIRCFVPEAES